MRRNLRASKRMAAAPPKRVPKTPRGERADARAARAADRAKLENLKKFKAALDDGYILGTSGNVHPSRRENVTDAFIRAIILDDGWDDAMHEKAIQLMRLNNRRKKLYRHTGTSQRTFNVTLEDGTFDVVKQQTLPLDVALMITNNERVHDVVGYLLSQGVHPARAHIRTALKNYGSYRDGRKVLQQLISEGGIAPNKMLEVLVDEFEDHPPGEGIKILQVLVSEFGADINAVISDEDTDYARTALTVLIEGGFPDDAARLLDLGAKINVPGTESPADVYMGWINDNPGWPKDDELLARLGQLTPAVDDRRMAPERFGGDPPPLRGPLYPLGNNVSFVDAC